MSPYGVDKKLGGDSPSNVKWMEKCVSGISGTNKRTGKPYTEGEKIAICKAQLRKSKSKSEELPEEIVIEESTEDEVEDTMEQCIRKMMDSGKAKTTEEAHQMCQAMLSRSNYEAETLQFFLTKIL